MAIGLAGPGNLIILQTGAYHDKSRFSPFNWQVRNLTDIRPHHVLMALFIAVLCHALAIYGIGQIRHSEKPLALPRIIQGILIPAPQPVSVPQAIPEASAMAPAPETEKPAETTPVEKPLPAPENAISVDTHKPEPEPSSSPDTISTTTSTAEAVQAELAAVASAHEPVIIPPHVDATNKDNPPPVYPRLARRLGQEGTVVLELLILPDGSVGDLRVKTSSGFPGLDKAALEAAKAWRYVPAKRGDEPIQYWYSHSVKFVLN